MALCSLIPNQARLILGSNAGGNMVAPAQHTVGEFEHVVRTRYVDQADTLLRVYRAHSDGEERLISGALFGDLVFSWQNWTWAQLPASSGHHPTHYNHSDRGPNLPAQHPFMQPVGPWRGSIHGPEILYAFGDRATTRWIIDALDRSPRSTITAYWVNFSGRNPNGDPPRRMAAIW